MAISSGELWRFVHTNAQSPFFCRGCSRAELSFASGLGGGPNADSPVPLRANFEDPPGNLAPYHAFYALICLHCAHAHFFHQGLVDLWLQKNPPVGDSVKWLLSHQFGRYL